MKNPLFSVGYWYQRLIVCPLHHGRQKAHAEHVTREQEAHVKELKAKYGENLERMPRPTMPLFVVGGMEAASPDTDSGELGAFNLAGRKPN